MPPQPVLSSDQNLQIKRSNSRSKSKLNQEESKEEKKVSKSANEESKAAEASKMSKFFTPKPFTDHSASNCAKLTRYVEVTIWELLQKIKSEEKDKHRKVGEEETCAICMSELYENIEKTSEEEVKKMHE